MEQTHNQSALRLSNGSAFRFAAPGAGRKNSLLVDTIELFGPRYAQEALILHLHDPANAITIHESMDLAEVGIPLLPHELLPDIILYQAQKRSLFLIGVSMMSGTFSARRKQALEQQMVITHLRRIYVSAFFDYEDYTSAAHDIAWRSYVWLAHMPDHVIVHW